MTEHGALACYDVFLQRTIGIPLYIEVVARLIG
jgi:hypothetical protein